MSRESCRLIDVLRTPHFTGMEAYTSLGNAMQSEPRVTKCAPSEPLND